MWCLEAGLLADFQCLMCNLKNSYFAKGILALLPFLTETLFLEWSCFLMDCTPKKLVSQQKNPGELSCCLHVCLISHLMAAQNILATLDGCTAGPQVCSPIGGKVSLMILRLSRKNNSISVWLYAPEREATVHGPYDPTFAAERVRRCLMIQLRYIFERCAITGDHDILPDRHWHAKRRIWDT